MRDLVLLELKKVTYRGVRMSRAQRRNVAYKTPQLRARASTIYRLNSGRNVYDAGSMRGDPGVTLLGAFETPAARPKGQAARAKRLRAAGVGPAKPSKRMKAIRKARGDLQAARQSARAFITANR